MDILSLLIIICAIGIIGAILFWQIKKQTPIAQDQETLKLLTVQFNERMAQMQQQMVGMQGSLDINIGTFQQQMSSTNKSINERLDKASEVISAVSKNLGEMSEIGRTMQDFQSLLRSPKFRGGVGEFILQDLLEQILPSSSFHMQYGFRNGSIVDAALKIDQGVIPIDAKFPSDNYRKMADAKTDADHMQGKKDFERDVKKHMEDISRKYICPDEGTVEFAIMYIPSEAVYQEIVCNETLMNYAHQKSIWPVSPNTFLYFLKLILFGLQGQKMEEQTKGILRLFKSLKIEQEKLGESLLLVAKHSRNTTSAADEAIKRHEKIAIKMTNTQFLSDGNDIDTVLELPSDTAAVRPAQLFPQSTETN